MIFAGKIFPQNDKIFNPTVTKNHENTKNFTPLKKRLPITRIKE
jgi:hypothetical protein